MTAPTPPDDPDAADSRTTESPSTGSPAAASPAAASPAAAAAPAAPTPPPGPPGPPPGYYPAPYPFEPRYREPWVNPAKRATLGLVAVLVAIVLLGGGFVLGAAVGHSHRGDGGRSIELRPMPGRIGGYGMPGRGVNPRPHFQGPRLQGPHFQGPHVVPSPTSPRPAPSSSHR
jgi:hypothetical protein